MRVVRVNLCLLVVLAACLAGCTGQRSNHIGSFHPRIPVSGTSKSASSGVSPQGGSADLAGTAWRIPRKSAGRIEGYANRSSVSSGQPVTLYVSTRAPRFLVRAFRMGWYRGVEGRQTWVSRSTSGHQQSAAVLAPAATRTRAADWAPSLTVSTTGWAPGDYLLRLETSTKHQSFVPLTVRGPSAAGRLVLVNAVTTWQAYNVWGCCDLYHGEDGAFATRSRAVTFDRPYQAEHGAGAFLSRELPVVAEAERLNLPLDYVTDVDIHDNPHLLDGAHAIVSMGHDEYWSPAMRSAVTRARDAGTNLAFLGANAIFRRIRFASTPLGPNRLEINYKDPSEDPLNGQDTADVTANWPAPPGARPESSLLGNQYACYPGGSVPTVAGVIVDPGNWLFAGAHVSSGQRLPGLIGPETDAVQLGNPTPRPIEVLLHSPTHCPGNTPPDADTSYYVAPSGAGVFDAGTMDWACAISGHCDQSAPITGSTQRVTRQVTDNLLTTFALGPAGRRHPAHDNLLALGISHH